MSDQPVIGFCGMSHLGITSSIASASKGFFTYCFDDNASLVEQLKLGNLGLNEPNLDEAWKSHNGLIKYTSNANDLSNCDVVYISKDVGTDEYGNSFIDDIDALVELTKLHVHLDCTIVVLCQVLPGFTRQKSKNCNLFYQVETLIFGEAYQRAMYPERFIIGCSSPKEKLPRAYNLFLESYNCSIHQMSYESAELAKISINLMLISSLTMANKLGRLCEEIGANWNDISPVLKLDKRIGPFAYLKTGLGFAGGNLERDLTSVQKLCSDHGIDNKLFESIVKINEGQRDWAYQKLTNLDNWNENLRVAILGVTYKPDTNSVKNSPSIELIKKLKGFNIITFDPLVRANEYLSWCPVANSMDEACQDADVVVLMTPWQEFINADYHHLLSLMSGNLFLDPHDIIKNNFHSGDSPQVIKAGLSKEDY